MRKGYKAIHMASVKHTSRLFMKDQLSIKLVFLCFTLTACGATATAVRLRPDAATVRIAKAEPPAECKEVGPIEGIHGSGCGAFGREGNYEGAYNALKNKAADRGANFVRIDQQIPPHSENGCYDQQFVMRGIAFKCP